MRNEKSEQKNSLYKLIMAAIFLALALILPFLTGQIKEIGNALCPMHIPVLLCGFFCGPWYGLAVGFVAPLFRFFLFGMPVIVPSGIGMSFELATYGFVSGMLYMKLPKTKANIYISLIAAMISGRVVWGAARVLLLGIGGFEFTWPMFIAGAFTKSIPGIIVQLVLIPVIVMTLSKTKNV